MPEQLIRSFMYSCARALCARTLARVSSQAFPPCSAHTRFRSRTGRARRSSGRAGAKPWRASSGRFRSPREDPSTPFGAPAAALSGSRGPGRESLPQVWLAGAGAWPANPEQAAATARLREAEADIAGRTARVREEPREQ